MTDYKTRLLTESRQLDNRIGDLERFIFAGSCINMNKPERNLLLKQLSIMQELYSILSKRIALLYQEPFAKD